MLVNSPGMIESILRPCHLPFGVPRPAYVAAWAAPAAISMS